MPQKSLCREVERGTALDLGAPPDIGAAHARHPDAVPLLVEVALAAGAASRRTRADQAVAHRPRRVDLEVVAGAAVEVRVDRPHEPIVGRERLVALHLVAEQAAGLRVVTDDTEDEPMPFEQHAHSVRPVAVAPLSGSRCRKSPAWRAAADRPTAVEVDRLSVEAGGDAVRRSEAQRPASPMAARRRGRTEAGLRKSRRLYPGDRASNSAAFDRAASGIILPYGNRARPTHSLMVEPGGRY
jgi:hypothetical protein